VYRQVGVETEAAVRKELQVQLQSLRPALLAECDRSFLNLFDEFEQQHEFDLALCVVCDFIIDSDSPQVSKSIIDRILRLHSAMKINDGCVQKLQSRMTA
jgi:hypothetical protein